MKKIVFLVSTVILGLAVAQGAAAQNPFIEPLSEKHTLFGHSQMWAGLISRDAKVAVKFWNPNEADYLAASLFYESERGNNSGMSELFTGCQVRFLSPHAATSSGLFYLPSNNFSALYAETIAVPRVAQTLPQGGAPTRLADGFGVGATHAKNVHSRATAINPSLFSLPSDSVAAGQRQLAIDCVCALLEGLRQEFGPAREVFRESFSDFGISCPIPS